MSSSPCSYTTHIQLRVLCKFFREAVLTLYGTPFRSRNAVSTTADTTATYRSLEEARIRNFDLMGLYMLRTRHGTAYTVLFGNIYDPIAITPANAVAMV